MATGGTIPKSRQQSVTFYNTTGIIERNKNIYLAPRFSKVVPALTARTQVRNAFLTVLTQVCPPSSSYTGIEIGNWSPQDRVLRVRGNIDDFRLVSEEGDCLNYFILTRTVTKVENNVDVARTYYYGFFITGVQQEGGSSVALTVQPDDFTNVFYLHNEHELTLTEIANDYEPFNSKLKNCYVNRQHYNRVALENVQEYEVHEDEQRIHVDGNSSIEIKIPIEHTVMSTSSLVNNTRSLTLDEPALYTILQSVELDLQLGMIVKYTIRADSSDALDGIFNYHFEIPYTSHKQVPANMKVFLNQEETYRFKYQYRDLKYPISIYDGNFTDEEMETIENEDTFSNLPTLLQKKIVRACISYLVVETKSPEIALPYMFDNLIGATHNILKRRLRIGELINDELHRPNPVIAVPYIEVPEVFSKYNIDSFKCYIMVYGKLYGGSLSSSETLVSEMCKVINKNAVAEYIYSVYYSKDVNIPYSNITIDLEHNRVDFNAVIPNYSAPTSTPATVYDGTLETNIYASGILQEPINSDSGIDENHSVHVNFVSGSQSGVITVSGARGLIVSGLNKAIFNITIKEHISNLKTNYYENVLEAEPYRFYSISYLSSYEMTFNKNRYFVGGIKNDIEMVHYVSFNGAVKEAYVPNYIVDSHKTKYYNEGLIFTTSANLPLVSDSYSAYYYQNQAQMKNQFAVAEYQWSADFAQKFFVSSPNQVGLRASKAGGWGALAETGNQVMGWIDDAIDLAQQEHIIGMNQKAKLADMGMKPDTLKQAGSDIIFDLSTKEICPYLNHYTIDNLSYNSIAKLLERTGYQVNLYDSLHTMDRVGWNFIKLNSFDYVADITIAQEDSIRKIFTEGVTLLHDKTYLTTGHNFETILEGGD